MARTKDNSREKAAHDSTLEERRPEDELALKDRVLAEAAEGITIADATQPDCPLIYVNKGFEQLTGYSSESVQGRNCRFLQGPDTDPAATDEIRRAIREGRPCVVEILNYRKDGSPFWNRLSITPVRDDAGALTHFIGIQSDVTARRNAEDALRQATAELEEANRRIKRDLEMASVIQRSYLPPRTPAVKGVRIAWELVPCDELAGDTLNIVSLEDRHVVFYVIDVSGHGVQAALLSAALTHWLLPSADGRAGGAGAAAGGEDADTAGAVGVERAGAYLSPVAVAEHLNKRFPLDPETGQYFTMIYGVLDVHSREFRFVTAGHPAPIHVTRDRQPLLHPSRGLPVGIVAEPQFEENVLRLEPGDRVYLYSDGLIDIVNAKGEPFETERLREELLRARGEPIEKSVEAVVSSVKRWSRGTHVEDDISILAFEIE
jgi:PAS domain S-box-containing protein